MAYESISFVIKSAQPRCGVEFEYWLAAKHRERYAALFRRTPFWKVSSKRRRWAKHMAAIERFHQFGNDLIWKLEPQS